MKLVGPKFCRRHLDSLVEITQTSGRGDPPGCGRWKIDLIERGESTEWKTPMKRKPTDCLDQGDLEGHATEL